MHPAREMLRFGMHAEFRSYIPKRRKCVLGCMTVTCGASEMDNKSFWDAFLCREAGDNGKRIVKMCDLCIPNRNN